MSFMLSLDDRNRTECVHHLRGLVNSLKKQDFLSLGRDALTRVCKENDTLCTDERNLFIDLIAREGSPEAQAMILEFVMKHPEVTEEDLRRCLFHAIAISDPVKVTKTTHYYVDVWPVLVKVLLRVRL